MIRHKNKQTDQQRLLFLYKKIKNILTWNRGSNVPYITVGFSYPVVMIKKTAK